MRLRHLVAISWFVSSLAGCVGVIDGTSDGPGGLIGGGGVCPEADQVTGCTTSGDFQCSKPGHVSVLDYCDHATETCDPTYGCLPASCAADRCSNPLCPGSGDSQCTNPPPPPPPTYPVCGGTTSVLDSSGAGWCP